MKWWAPWGRSKSAPEKPENSKVADEGTSAAEEAVLFYDQRNWCQALAKYREALGYFRRVGDLPQQAENLRYIGEILLRQQKIVHAMEHFVQSHLIYQNIADSEGEIATSLGMASCYLRLNRRDKALTNYHRALTYCEQMGDSQATADICRRIGDVYLQEMKPEEAAKYYSRALLYYRQNDATIAREIAARLEDAL